MSLRTMFTDFRRGLSIIFSKPKKGEGDRKLAKMSLIVEGQIPMYGKHVVQAQVIKSVEKDLKRAAGKGTEKVDALVANALATPEYMHMLKRLGLEEAHLIVMAKQAKREALKDAH